MGVKVSLDAPEGMASLVDFISSLFLRYTAILAATLVFSYEPSMAVVCGQLNLPAAVHFFS